MKNLKELRISKKLSQEEVAKIINISQSNYGKYENNKSEPNINNLIKLADYLKTSIDYLVGREEKFLLYLTKLNQDEREIIEKLKDLDSKQKMRLNIYIDEMIRLRNELEQEQKKNGRFTI